MLNNFCSQSKKILLAFFAVALFGVAIGNAGAVERKKTAPIKTKVKKNPTKSSAIKIKTPLKKKASKPVHPDNVPSDIMVDLEYENTSVGRALHYFMDPLNVRLKFHDGADKLKVTGSFDNRPWRDALETVVQQAGLQYEVVQGVIEISKAPEPITPPPELIVDPPTPAAETTPPTSPSTMNGALSELPSGPEVPMDPPSVDESPMPTDPPSKESEI